jgi:Mn-dependent DtxR family transcriptional regulator
MYDKVAVNICRTYVNHMSERDVTDRQQAMDYVKAIYVLEERGVEVTTTTLAAELGVTPSLVAEMVARLRQMGLIN